MSNEKSIIQELLNVPHNIYAYLGSKVIIPHSGGQQLYLSSKFYASKKDWNDPTFYEISTYENPVTSHPVFETFVKCLLAKEYNEAHTTYIQLEESVDIDPECITFYIHDFIRHLLMMCFFEDNISSIAIHRATFAKDALIQFTYHPLLDYLFYRRWWCSEHIMTYLSSVFTIQSNVDMDVFQYFLNHLPDDSPQRQLFYVYRDDRHTFVKTVFYEIMDANPYVNSLENNLVSTLLFNYPLHPKLIWNRLQSLFAIRPEYKTNGAIQRQLKQAIQVCCDDLIEVLLERAQPIQGAIDPEDLMTYLSSTTSNVAADQEEIKLHNKLYRFTPDAYPALQKAKEFSERWYYRFLDLFNPMMNDQIIQIYVSELRFDLVRLALQNGYRMNNDMIKRCSQRMDVLTANIPKMLLFFDINDYEWRDLFDRKYKRVKESVDKSVTKFYDQLRTAARSPTAEIST